MLLVYKYNFWHTTGFIHFRNLQSLYAQSVAVACSGVNSTMEASRSPFKTKFMSSIREGGCVSEYASGYFVTRDFSK